MRAKVKITVVKKLGTRDLFRDPIPPSRATFRRIPAQRCKVGDCLRFVPEDGSCPLLLSLGVGPRDLLVT